MPEVEELAVGTHGGESSLRHADGVIGQHELAVAVKGLWLRARARARAVNRERLRERKRMGGSREGGRVEEIRFSWMGRIDKVTLVTSDR